MALTKLTEGANKSLQCAEFNSLSFVMDRISEVEPDDTAHIPSMSLQVTRVLSILTQVALTGERCCITSALIPAGTRS